MEICNKKYNNDGNNDMKLKDNVGPLHMQCYGGWKLCVNM